MKLIIQLRSKNKKEKVKIKCDLTKEDGLDQAYNILNTYRHINNTKKLINKPCFNVFDATLPINKIRLHFDGKKEKMSLNRAIEFISIFRNKGDKKKSNIVTVRRDRKVVK